MLCKKLNLYYVGTSIVCSVISALSPCCKFCVGPAQMFCLSCAKIRGIVSGLSGEHAVIGLGKILRYGSMLHGTTLERL